MPARLLIVDDDVDLCHLLSRYLTKKGYETTVACSGAKGLAKFKSEKFDGIIADYRLGDMDGVELLRELKVINNRVPVLIITGYSDIRPAVEVIRMGAFDYIPKPLVPEEMLKLLTKMLSDKEAVSAENPTPVEAPKEQPYFIGKSPAATILYEQVDLVAPTNYSVILYGESGTGKEVIARTIHHHSKRAGKPFVAIDCGTLSKDLAGSELFGHIKGSFTGAVTDRQGHFEVADGGTLFLDEVANLTPPVQAALLRVIQERKFKRLGGSTEKSTDVRIIVASNENLKSACASGRFREDLYHRLNEFAIQLPALRERGEDIEAFAGFFLNKCAEENGKQLNGFDPEVIQAFRRYDWPGNLRELRNVIRRATLLTAENNLIQKSVLIPEILSGSTIPAPGTGVEKTVSGDSNGDYLKDVAAQAEYKAIMTVLQQVNFNKKKAAELLKIDRKTLYNKLKLFEAQI